MALTTEQKTTLKNAILADPILNAFPNTLDGAFDMEVFLRNAATPDFIVWRTNVPASDIGNAWMGADIDGMSSLNMQRLQLLLASAPGGTFDMSRLDRRIGFLNPFGASTANPSRVAMNIVFKRKASYLEKLFASGTGTDVSPATMVIEGSIPYQEVFEARNA